MYIYNKNVMKIIFTTIILLFSLICYGQNTSDLSKDQKIQLLELRIKILNEQLKNQNLDTLEIKRELIDYSLETIKKTINKDTFDEYLELYYYVLNHETAKDISSEIVDFILDYTEELKVHVRNIPQKK